MTMTENNGHIEHHNGGQGAVTSDIDHHGRATLRLIRRAILNRWEVKDEWKAELPKVAARMVADDNVGERERLRAMEVLRAMERDNIDAAKELHRIEQLEAGDPTDIHEFQVSQQDEEIARRIAHERGVESEDDHDQ